MSVVSPVDGLVCTRCCKRERERELVCQCKRCLQRIAIDLLSSEWGPRLRKSPLGWSTWRPRCAPLQLCRYRVSGSPVATTCAYTWVEDSRGGTQVMRRRTARRTSTDLSGPISGQEQPPLSPCKAGVPRPDMRRDSGPCPSPTTTPEVVACTGLHDHTPWDIDLHLCGTYGMPDVERPPQPPAFDTLPRRRYILNATACLRAGLEPSSAHSPNDTRSVLRPLILAFRAFYKLATPRPVGP